LITTLDEYFTAIDKIIEKWKLEKIKMIGDSYMCAGGLPRLNKSNPIQAVLAGLEIQRFIKDKNEQYKANNKVPWEMRIGIHTGDIIAGILGGSKYSYDIWGDTVNIASRMESEGEVGKVNISGVTYEDIKNYFLCIPRNKIKTKNIGELDMYFVEKIKPEYSEDDTGLEPNGKFLKIIDRLFHSKEI
jgi:class 3 adenylate cyclase